MSNTESNTEISRREALKLIAYGGAAGAAAAFGLSKLFQAREGQHDNLLLETDFRLFQSKIEDKNNDPAYMGIFVYLPEVLKREGMVNNEMYRLLGENNKDKLLFYKEKGLSLGVELLSNPDNLPANHRDIYDLLKEQGWKDPVSIMSFNELSTGGYGMKYYICGEHITLRDAASLSFSLPGEVKISKGEQENHLFQNEILEKLFGYRPEVLFAYGFGVYTLDRDNDSSFGGMNRIINSTFTEWVLDNEIRDVDSIVFPSSAGSAGRFIFEDLCRRAKMTYRQVIEMFMKSDVDNFARELSSGIDRTRIMNLPELGAFFLNLTSFVEEVAPLLDGEDRNSWSQKWNESLSYFSENLIPHIPSPGDKQKMQG